MGFVDGRVECQTNSARNEERNLCNYCAALADPHGIAGQELPTIHSTTRTRTWKRPFLTILNKYEDSYGILQDDVQVPGPRRRMDYFKTFVIYINTVTTD